MKTRRWKIVGGGWIARSVLECNGLPPFLNDSHCPFIPHNAGRLARSTTRRFIASLSVLLTVVTVTIHGQVPELLQNGISFANPVPSLIIPHIIVPAGQGSLMIKASSVQAHDLVTGLPSNLIDVLLLANLGGIGNCSWTYEKNNFPPDGFSIKISNPPAGDYYISMSCTEVLAACPYGASSGSVIDSYTVTATTFTFGALLNTNLLQNPGFESGLTGWTTDNGALRQTDPNPNNGTNYLMGGNNGTATSYTYQKINLLEYFSAQQLDSGSYLVDFGGFQNGWHGQTDSGNIAVTCLNSQSTLLASANTGWFWSNNSWVLRENKIMIPSGTRFITYGFYAQRYQGNNNDAYLDDAFLDIIMTRPQSQSVFPENSNLRFYWQGEGGSNYVVQASTSLSLNNSFVDISPVISLPGSGLVSTNYLDVGALTNFPVRFYRVRSD